jgi:predicted secreted protein
MTLSFGIFTFINVWWVMLFMVLPVGVRMSASRTNLEYAAAPQPHKWKKLFIINSIISFFVTLMIALLIHYDAVPLKNLISE